MLPLSTTDTMDAYNDHFLRVFDHWGEYSKKCVGVMLLRIAECVSALQAPSRLDFSGSGACVPGVWVCGCVVGLALSLLCTVASL